MITRTEALEILQRDNSRQKPDVLRVYLDAFFDYAEAAANIARNGTICAHPRTSEPIKNPYLEIKAAAVKALRAFPRPRRTEALWDLLNAELAGLTPQEEANGSLEENNSENEEDS